MQSFHFLRGLAIGFALAAPVGPVGILCIRRALADGRYAAFIAGLGAAFADTFYGAVAGLGITVISGFLLAHATILRVVGGIFLLVLGAMTWRAPPKLAPEPGSGPGLLRDFISTFLITLSNPGTILASMGVFAAFGALGNDKPAEASVLIFGVFAGSTLWWLVLSAMAGAIRSKLTDGWMTKLNHVSGGALLVFGAAILLSLAWPL
ncbi:MAG TPA: LysE family transporter [Candidatus Sulfotelmatobacter sp.]|jgi:threonine/homoserine/homoserine lactone efflux protein|nr:LysE family transporter [Candidatus Sulfotelmatobacter sp.]